MWFAYLLLPIRQGQLCIIRKTIMTEKTKKKTHKNQSISTESQLNIFRFITILLLGILIVVLVAWAMKYFREERAAEQYDGLQEQVNNYDFSNDIVQETETETEQIDILTQLGIEVPDKNLDWDSLHAMNPDIYAWIYIPNTNVDYPILQHPSEDNYYLEHNLDGSKGYPGCIYTQSQNRKDFSDFNTVIYGHNMKNGSMFRSLHYFEDADFFEQNPYAYIYTEQGALVYHIYAAYETDNSHILNTNDFTSEEGINAYLEKAYAAKSWNGNYRDGVEICAQNRIITLSTCVSGKASKRYVVQGVLINAPYTDGAQTLETQAEEN